MLLHVLDYTEDPQLRWMPCNTSRTPRQCAAASHPDRIPASFLFDGMPNRDEAGSLAIMGQGIRGGVVLHPAPARALRVWGRRGFAVQARGLRRMVRRGAARNIQMFQSRLAQLHAPCRAPACGEGVVPQPQRSASRLRALRARAASVSARVLLRAQRSRALLPSRLRQGGVLQPRRLRRICAQHGGPLPRRVSVRAGPRARCRAAAEQQRPTLCAGGAAGQVDWRSRT